jgi:hypothetical protein
MRPAFESDEARGTFFLAMLPNIMDNVIDGLSICGLPSFRAIEPKILDVAEKHSHDRVDFSTAYAARQTAAQTRRGGQ